MIARILSLIVAVAFAISSVHAQAPAANPLVGTWRLVAADKILPDGTRVPDYGTQPRGLAIFTADGYYSVQIYRADRAKLSSDDRLKVPPDEYKNTALSMSVHFGRYDIDKDKHTITFHVDRASWPNWDDTVQVRTFEIKGDELSWKVAPRPDGSVPITVLRRAASK